jgi:hypothetical protein
VVETTGHSKFKPAKAGWHGKGTPTRFSGFEVLVASGFNPRAFMDTKETHASHRQSLRLP